jgi:hypothetical protein
VHEYIAARFKGARRDPAWPCTGTVVLGVPAREVRPFVSEGMITELGPDRCKLTAGSWSWTALAASIARFDAPISQVAPTALIDAFRALSARLGSISGTTDARP